MQCAENRNYGMDMAFKHKMCDTGIFNFPWQDLRCTGLSASDRCSDQFIVFIHYLFTTHRVFNNYSCYIMWPRTIAGFCSCIHVWLRVLLNAWIMLKFRNFAWRFLPTIDWILEALCSVIIILLSYKIMLGDGIVCKIW